MYDAAAEVYGVSTVFAVDQRMIFFKTNIFDTKQCEVESKDHTAHFYGRMCCFRIYAACVCNTDRKIHITHDLRIDDIGHFRNRQCFSVFPVSEDHTLQSRRFYIGRREPIRLRIDRSDDIVFIIDFLQAVLVICHPAPSFQCADRPFCLYLISCKHQTAVFVQFLRQFNIQFTEHLTERLFSAFAVSDHQQSLLIIRPDTLFVKVWRMSDPQCRFITDAVNISVLIWQSVLCHQTADECISVRDEYKVFGDRFRDRIFTEQLQLSESEQVTFFHRCFKHSDSPAVLLTELSAEFFYRQKMRIFLQGRRDRFELFPFLFDRNIRLSERIDHDLYIIAFDLGCFKITAVLLHESRFHRECEPCFITEARCHRKIFECISAGFPFACSALCAELFAFFQECLYKLVSLQNIRFTLWRNDRQRHEQVFISLFGDDVFRFGNVHFAKRRIRIFSGACVLVPCGWILCAFIQLIKDFFPESFIYLKEPSDIKAAAVEFLFR